MTVFVNAVGAARRATRVVLAGVVEERGVDEDIREVVLGRAVVEETIREDVDAVLRDATTVELLNTADCISSVPFLSSTPQTRLTDDCALTNTSLTCPCCAAVAFPVTDHSIGTE